MSESAIILVLNSGSSSIKFEVFRMPEEKVEAKGLLERIGEPESRLFCRIGEHAEEVEGAVSDHAEGLGMILDLLSSAGPEPAMRIDAVGHRVVHGGEAFAAPVLVTDEVEEAVRANFDLAPLHNPANLLGMEAAGARLPGAQQVAVFDTAFHQSMPPRAYRYALPEDLYREGRVRRYGFHGTSHRFVCERAAALLGRSIDETKLVSCHLGNGCSVAAVSGGRSIDTSMGLTPLEGLVMGTRSGDLDPSIAAFLARTRGMSADDVDTLLNKKSGLLGLSGKSNDMRALLRAERDGDERASLAVEVYCYRLKKYLGAYAAVLGELHAVVFTAGVGENSPVIRSRTLAGLERMGLIIDEERNLGAAGVEADVASAESPVRILVIPTNEELMIARDTHGLLRAS